MQNSLGIPELTHDLEAQKSGDFEIRSGALKATFTCSSGMIWKLRDAATALFLFEFALSSTT